MATKDYLLDKFDDNKTYSKRTIQYIVDSIDFRIRPSPTKFKKGDVIKLQNLKGRPGVVISVQKELLVVIPLTTTEGTIFELCPYKSRFFGKGFFTNQVVSVPITSARHLFLGVFDSILDLNRAIEKVKQFSSLVV